jgi:hypothetical protein
MKDVEILRSLDCNRCICGKRKKEMMSHCRSCYFSLPPENRKALYRKFNQGYQEAYRESLKILGIEPERIEQYASTFSGIMVDEIGSDFESWLGGVNE